MYNPTQIHDQLLPPLIIQSKSPGIVDSLKDQWSSSRRRFLLFKTAVVCLGLTTLALNSSMNFTHHIAPINCYKDAVQEFILPLTEYLGKNNAPRDALTIISSLFIDICMTLFFIRWVFYGRSLRLAITVGFFYGFRGFVQRMFSMKFPDHYVFADPGFFSIAVPYFKTNDFFFSGHIGICTIIFNEFKKDKSVFLTVFAFIAIVINFFMLISTEGHFIIDLTVGIMTGHYIWRICLWIEGTVEKSDNPCCELFGKDDEEIKLKIDESALVIDTSALNENNKQTTLRKRREEDEPHNGLQVERI